MRVHNIPFFLSRSTTKSAVSNQGTILLRTVTYNTIARSYDTCESIPLATIFEGPVHLTLC